MFLFRQLIGKTGVERIDFPHVLLLVKQRKIVEFRTEKVTLKIGKHDVSAIRLRDNTLARRKVRQHAFRDKRYRFKLVVVHFRSFSVQHRSRRHPREHSAFPREFLKRLRIVASEEDMHVEIVTNDCRNRISVDAVQLGVGLYDQNEEDVAPRTRRDGRFKILHRGK